MGLFGVRIGLSGGENEVKNEVAFVAFAIVGDGNGRVVSENGDSIGEMVVVDVVVIQENPSDDVLNLIDGNRDADGLGRRDAIGDGGEDGEFHGDRMRQDRRSVKTFFDFF